MKFHQDGSRPLQNQIFVFGSNLSGIHGAGAAKAAHQFYSAKWGVAEGFMGRSYAIPTVQKQIAGSLTLEQIKPAVRRFLAYAAEHPESEFLVTRIGCVLAGHKDADIAPMFAEATDNCSLPHNWRPILEDTK